MVPGFPFIHWRLILTGCLTLVYGISKLGQGLLPKTFFIVTSRFHYKFYHFYHETFWLNLLRKITGSASSLQIATSPAEHYRLNKHDKWNDLRWLPQLSGSPSHIIHVSQGCLSRLGMIVTYCYAPSESQSNRSIC